MTVEELVSTLGLEIDDDDLAGFQTAIVSATAKIGALVVGALAAAASISKLLDEASEVDKASKFARSVDVAFESLQRLEYAAEQNGLGVGELRGALSSLQGAARAAANGIDSGAIVAFARLGVSTRDANGALKTADKLFLELADSVKNSKNQGLALELTEQLGLGHNFNLALRQGADGLNALGDEAGRLGIILGGEAAKESEKFSDSMKKLEASAKQLLFKAGLPLLEWLNDMVDAFLAFANSDKGQETIRRFGVAFEVLWKAVDLLAEPFRVVSALFEEFGPIALLVLAPAIPILWAFAAGLWGVLSPALITASALTALLAALNELRVFFASEDNDSLISRGLSALGYDPKNVRANLIDAFGTGAEGLANIGSLIGGAATTAGDVLNYLPGTGATSVSAGAAAPITVNNDITVDGAQSPGQVADSIKRITADDIREATKSTSSRVLK